jgi:hypothetical protein
MNKFVEPIVFRLNCFRLDAQLAAGQPAESSARHARRARMLVAPRARRSLADSWEHLLTVATRPARGLSGRAPIRRRQVLRAEPEIRDLIGALNASGPVPAQGVAMARLLLTDGTSLIYSVGDDDADLAELVCEAARRLDPSQPLMAAAHMPVVKPTVQAG